MTKHSGMIVDKPSLKINHSMTAEKIWERILRHSAELEKYYEAHPEKIPQPASGGHFSLQVLGCSDSRIVREYYEGDGSVEPEFTADYHNTAGNTAPKSVRSAIEEKLNLNPDANFFVLVNSHYNGDCGAAAAAHQACCANPNLLENAENEDPLIGRMMPAVKAAMAKKGPDATVEDVTPTEIAEANLQLTIEELMQSEIIRDRLKKGKLVIGKAMSNMQTGKLENLQIVKGRKKGWTIKALNNLIACNGSFVENPKYQKLRDETHKNQKPPLAVVASPSVLLKRLLGKATRIGETFRVRIKARLGKIARRSIAFGILHYSKVLLVTGETEEQVKMRLKGIESLLFSDKVQNKIQKGNLIVKGVVLNEKGLIGKVIEPRPMSFPQSGSFHRDLKRSPQYCI